MFGIETPMGRTPFQSASLDVTSPRAKAPDFAKPTSRLAFWRHIPQHEGRHSVATAAWAILLDKHYKRTGAWNNLGKLPGTALTLTTLGLLFIFMGITGIGIQRRPMTNRVTKANAERSSSCHP